jgi:hypothetical protein
MAKKMVNSVSSLTAGAAVSLGGGDGGDDDAGECP